MRRAYTAALLSTLAGCGLALDFEPPLDTARDRDGGVDSAYLVDSGREGRDGANDASDPDARRDGNADGAADGRVDGPNDGASDGSTGDGSTGDGSTGDASSGDGSIDGPSDGSTDGSGGSDAMVDAIDPLTVDPCDGMDNDGNGIVDDACCVRVGPRGVDSDPASPRAPTDVFATLQSAVDWALFDPTTRPRTICIGSDDCAADPTTVRRETVVVGFPGVDIVGSHDSSTLSYLPCADVTTTVEAASRVVMVHDATVRLERLNIHATGDSSSETIGLVITGTGRVDPTDVAFTVDAATGTAIGIDHNATFLSLIHSTVEARGPSAVGIRNNGGNASVIGCTTRSCVWGCDPGEVAVRATGSSNLAQALLSLASSTVSLVNVGLCANAPAGPATAIRKTMGNLTTTAAEIDARGRIATALEGSGAGAAGPVTTTVSSGSITAIGESNAQGARFSATDFASLYDTAIVATSRLGPAGGIAAGTMSLFDSSVDVAAGDAAEATGVDCTACQSVFTNTIAVTGGLRRWGINAHGGSPQMHQNRVALGCGSGERRGVVLDGMGTGTRFENNQVRVSDCADNVILSVGTALAVRESPDIVVHSNTLDGMHHHNQTDCNSRGITLEGCGLCTVVNNVLVANNECEGGVPIEVVSGEIPIRAGYNHYEDADSTRALIWVSWFGGAGGTTYSQGSMPPNARPYSMYSCLPGVAMGDQPIGYGTACDDGGTSTDGPATDIDGRSRTADTRPDIGAYELP